MNAKQLRAIIRDVAGVEFGSRLSPMPIGRAKHHWPIVLWLRFALAGSVTAAIGWPFVLAGIMVADAANLLRAFGHAQAAQALFSKSHPLRDALVVLGLASGIAFVFNLFVVAPIKVFRTIRKPVIIKLANSIGISDRIRNDTVKHQIFIEIENRSFADTFHCTVIVGPSIGPDGGVIIRTIALLPRQPKMPVEIASWFTRDAPASNDDFIRILAEHGGAFVQSSMIQLDKNGSEIDISVREADRLLDNMRLKLSIDEKSGSLCCWVLS
jgi:hypothetical protein